MSDAPVKRLARDIAALREGGRPQLADALATVVARCTDADGEQAAAVIVGFLSAYLIPIPPLPIDATAAADAPTAVVCSAPPSIAQPAPTVGRVVAVSDRPAWEQR